MSIIIQGRTIMRDEKKAGTMRKVIYVAKQCIDVRR